MLCAGSVRRTLCTELAVRQPDCVQRRWVRADCVQLARMCQAVLVDPGAAGASTRWGHEEVGYNSCIEAWLVKQSFIKLKPSLFCLKFETEPEPHVKSQSNQIKFGLNQY